MKPDLRPPKSKAGGIHSHLSKSEEKKRLGLYRQGFNDREIAERCGVHKVTINIWRRSKNLPSHPQKLKYDRAQLRQDYEQGMSYTDLHKKYGIDKKYSSIIIRQLGIARTESESLLFKTDGWRKLVPMQTGNTRILSLPAQIIQELGFDPNDELEGKWQTSSKELILKIRKREART